MIGQNTCSRLVVGGSKSILFDDKTRICVFMARWPLAKQVRLFCPAKAHGGQLRYKVAGMVTLQTSGASLIAKLIAATAELSYAAPNYSAQ